MLLKVLALWRSRHRIRLRNERPGFESRQGTGFLGKHSSAVVYKNDLICIVYELKGELKALVTKFLK
jgi:hypothetical protein